ncbi:MAG: hypothetical protein H0X63_12400 [Flavobacteriales bacterium]|jgi:hypothetical protein|nr:hypothetical protein [Flavobacteriales bacterium]
MELELILKELRIISSRLDTIESKIENGIDIFIDDLEGCSLVKEWDLMQTATLSKE